MPPEPRQRNPRLARILAVGAVFGLGLLPSHRRTPAVLAQAIDPAAVVQQFLDARNRGDVDGAAAAFSNDAAFIGAPPCTTTAPCVGSDAIRSLLQQAGRHEVVVVTDMRASGSIVTERLEDRFDGIQARGVERFIAAFMVVVPNDTTSLWVASPDAADAQTAQKG